MYVQMCVSVKTQACVPQVNVSMCAPVCAIIARGTAVAAAMAWESFVVAVAHLLVLLWVLMF